MIKFFPVLVFVCIPAFLHGQKIEVSITPTINNIYYYRFVSGGPKHRSKVGIGATVDYLFCNAKKLNFGFGFSYQHCPVEIIPNLNSGDLIRHTEKVNLLSVRLNSVYNFNRNLYLRLYPSIDFQVNDNSDQTIDKQSGMGLSAALGKHIPINEALTLNIEPKFEVHNVISFHNEGLHNKLTIVGINFGLVFGKRSQAI